MPRRVHHTQQRLLEKGDKRDATSALMLKLHLRRHASPQTPQSPQTAIFAGADHGDRAGEAKAARAVHSLMANTPGRKLVIDEFISRGAFRGHLPMEVSHSTYLKESFLGQLIRAYYAMETSNDNSPALTAAAKQSFGAKPSLRRLTRFATGEDGVSPALARRHTQLLRLAQRMGVSQTKVRAFYARVIGDVVSELERGSGQYTSNCGLARFRGNLTLAKIFGAFRASLDVLTFLRLWDAVRRGVSVVGLHAGRSHLKNVLTLLEEQYKCDAKKDTGKGSCSA
jgi:hypothetical protein